MKVLVVGNAQSNYVWAIIRHTLIEYGDTVTLLTNVAVKDGLEIPNGVRVVYGRRATIRKLNRFLYGTLNRKVLSEPYDMVCVHFADHSSLSSLHYCNHIPRRLVFFWGSDLFRDEGIINGATRWMKASLLRRATCIYVSTVPMQERFCALYGHAYDEKIGFVRFGSDRVDAVAQGVADRIETRRRFGIPNDKTIVSIGYNRSWQQQHIPALKALSSVPKEKRADVHVLLRMTYGPKDDDYLASVKEAADSTGCSYTVLTEYLTDEEVVSLTLATDVFVHAQTTDASSASMMEHLCAGSVVLNPSWIEYPELAAQCDYITYQSFDDLAFTLGEVIPVAQATREAYLRKNRDAILRLASWNQLREVWREAYGEKK